MIAPSPWHERDAESLVVRLRAPVYDRSARRRQPDIAWLLNDDALESHVSAAFSLAQTV